MRPDLRFITAKFNEYNKLYFDGKLPVPRLTISNSRRSLGVFTYRRERMPDGTFRFYDYTIKISNLIDREQQVVEDTIIHEMIHFYVHWNNLRDTSSHGQIFQRMMNTINRRHGRHITISHRNSEEERESDIQHRHHLVCIIRFKDGHYGVMSVSRTRIFELWDAPRQFAAVENYNWYSVVDPFFNRYPHIRTVKAYQISGEEVDKHLMGAVLLENIGDRIRPVFNR